MSDISLGNFHDFFGNPNNHERIVHNTSRKIVYINGNTPEEIGNQFKGFVSGIAPPGIPPPPTNSAPSIAINRKPQNIPSSNGYEKAFNGLIIAIMIILIIIVSWLIYDTWVKKPKPKPTNSETLE
jgi:hypothetical protein